MPFKKKELNVTILPKGWAGMSSAEIQKGAKSVRLAPKRMRILNFFINLKNADKLSLAEIAKKYSEKTGEKTHKAEISKTLKVMGGHETIDKRYSQPEIFDSNSLIASYANKFKRRRMMPLLVKIENELPEDISHMSTNHIASELGITFYSALYIMNKLAKIGYSKAVKWKKYAPKRREEAYENLIESGVTREFLGSTERERTRYEPPPKKIEQFKVVLVGPKTQPAPQPSKIETTAAQVVEAFKTHGFTPNADAAIEPIRKQMTPEEWGDVLKIAAQQLMPPKKGRKKHA